jgi:N4-(beta-N-acetylglucosaminyl)-L-asparaginase
MEALRRIKANTVEKLLLNNKGTPNFYVNFYILNAKGEYAGVTMYQGSNARFAMCDEHGPQTLSCEGLPEGKLSD